MRVVRVGGHDWEDCKISMPDWRQHLESGHGTDFASGQQTGDDHGQSYQYNHSSKQKTQLLAHDLLLAKRTPAHAPRFRLALPLLRLSVYGNGKNSVSCV